MKFWLAIDNPVEQSNYKVLSPLNGHNIFSIDDFIDDNEASEINLTKILTYLPKENIRPFLHKISTKLLHKGRLNIEDSDLYEINKLFFSGAINAGLYNEFVFGKHQHAWDFKQSITSLSEVEQILREAGLKIITKQISSPTFIISAERT